MPGIVRVWLRDGRTGEARVDLVKGHPGKPMNFDDVARKFTACAGFGRPGWRGAQRVIDAVRRLESLDDTGVLARLCLENT
jgi:2-methylcitrate dehydratase PrpD